jgi:hypothetical protein
MDMIVRGFEGLVKDWIHLYQKCHNIAYVSFK